MGIKEKRTSGNGIMRLVIVAVSFLLQVGWILLRVKWLNEYSEGISAFTGLLTIVVVLKLNSKNTNSAMKMPWVMLIMAFPMMGLSMYLLFEILGDPGVGKKMHRVRSDMKGEIPENARRAFSGVLDSISRRTARSRLPTPGSPRISISRYKVRPMMGKAIISMIQGIFMAEFVFLELIFSTTAMVSNAVSTEILFE